jgi:hypothetical protein
VEFPLLVLSFLESLSFLALFSDLRSSDDPDGDHHQSELAVDGDGLHQAEDGDGPHQAEDGDGPQPEAKDGDGAVQSSPSLRDGDGKVIQHFSEKE